MGRGPRRAGGEDGDGNGDGEGAAARGEGGAGAVVEAAEGVAALPLPIDGAAEGVGMLCVEEEG